MSDASYMPQDRRNTPVLEVAEGPRRRRTIRILALSAALALGATVAIGAATTAKAVTGYHVVVGSLGLNARSGPGTGYPVVGTLSNGQPIDIACQTKGSLVGVGLPGTPTDVWDRLTNGWYIADYYTSTPGLAGGYTAGIPQCGIDRPAPSYNRGAAVDWAIRNYNKPNGSWLWYNGNDCTYYVSQALWAGGIPRTADWTGNSRDPSRLASRWWNPGATRAAAHADKFKNYVVTHGIATIKEVRWADNTAGGAQMGDIIGYDWNNGADGVLDHLAIVTSRNQHGYPSVSQHSSPRLNRYWSWDPGANSWIQYSRPGSRVYLLHIIK
jgi:uncharacterized protein YraI